MHPNKLRKSSNMRPNAKKCRVVLSDDDTDDDRLTDNKKLNGLKSRKIESDNDIENGCSHSDAVFSCSDNEQEAEFSRSDNEQEAEFSRSDNEQEAEFSRSDNEQEAEFSRSDNEQEAEFSRSDNEQEAEFSRSDRESEGDVSQSKNEAEFSHSDNNEHANVSQNDDDSQFEECDSYFEDEAMEDEDAVESEVDYDRDHDSVDEHELAFQAGGSGAASREVLKNGQINCIDDYSSNSEDDEDLEDFVVDDNEVEYSSNVDDELPDCEFSMNTTKSSLNSPQETNKRKYVIETSDDDDRTSLPANKKHKKTNSESDDVTLIDSNRLPKTLKRSQLKNNKKKFLKNRISDSDDDEEANKLNNNSILNESKNEVEIKLVFYMNLRKFAKSKQSLCESSSPGGEAQNRIANEPSKLVKELNGLDHESSVNSNNKCIGKEETNCNNKCIGKEEINCNNKCIGKEELNEKPVIRICQKDSIYKLNFYDNVVLNSPDFLKWIDRLHVLLRYRKYKINAEAESWKEANATCVLTLENLTANGLACQFDELLSFYSKVDYDIFLATMAKYLIGWKSVKQCVEIRALLVALLIKITDHKIGIDLLVILMKRSSTMDLQDDKETCKLANILSVLIVWINLRIMNETSFMTSLLQVYETVFTIPVNKRLELFVTISNKLKQKDYFISEDFCELIKKNDHQHFFQTFLHQQKERKETLHNFYLSEIAARSKLSKFTNSDEAVNSVKESCINFYQNLDCEDYDRWIRLSEILFNKKFLQTSNKMLQKRISNILNNVPFADIKERIFHLFSFPIELPFVFTYITNAALHSNTFNATHCKLTAMLCKKDVWFKKTLKYSIWTNFEHLDRVTYDGLDRFKLFVSYLISRHCLNFTALKKLQLYHREKLEDFCYTILFKLFISSPKEVKLEKIFKLLVVSPKHTKFRKTIKDLIKRKFTKSHLPKHQMRVILPSLNYVLKMLET